MGMGKNIFSETESRKVAISFYFGNFWKAGKRFSLIWMLEDFVISVPLQSSPRFKRVVDRSHLLYRRQAQAFKTGGDQSLTETLRSLETTCVTETEAFLNNFTADRLPEVDDLFKDCVDSELKFYSA